MEHGCPHCHRSFKRWGMLNRHCGSHHPNIPDPIGLQGTCSPLYGPPPPPPLIVPTNPDSSQDEEELLVSIFDKTDVESEASSEEE